MSPHLEVFVEELSMEAYLQELLPRILGDRSSFAIYPFQGKEDLLACLPKRLKGYTGWIPPHYRIVVVVDRDDDDCRELKRQMNRFAEDAGLPTRTAVSSAHWQVANRIAVEELEAWYFGDWDAMRSEFPRVPSGLPAKSRFRDPDAITGGTWQSLEKVLQRAGYFQSGLRKIELARSLGRQTEPGRNSSTSFKCLLRTLREACGDVD